MVKTVTYIMAGLLTGAGLGTVFGAALILFLGKDFFSTGNTAAAASHDFMAHTNFMIGTMVVFGVIVAIITFVALNKNVEEEN